MDAQLCQGGRIAGLKRFPVRARSLWPHLLLMAFVAALGALRDSPVITDYVPAQAPVAAAPVINIIQPTMIKMHYTEAPVQMPSVSRVVNRQPASRGSLWVSECGGEDGGPVVREL